MFLDKVGGGASCNCFSCILMSPCPRAKLATPASGVHSVTRCLDKVASSRSSNLAGSAIGHHAECGSGC
jgi:hypothetical protein